MNWLTSPPAVVQLSTTTCVSIQTGKSLLWSSKFNFHHALKLYINSYIDRNLDNTRQLFFTKFIFFVKFFFQRLRVILASLACVLQSITVIACVGTINIRNAECSSYCRVFRISVFLRNLDCWEANNSCLSALVLLYISVCLFAFLTTQRPEINNYPLDCFALRFLIIDLLT